MSNGSSKTTLDRIIAKLETRNGSKYPMIDGHLHVVDFRQQCGGLKNLLRYMDQCHVPEAVIFGMGVTKLWDEDEKESPEYYLSDDAPCYHYSYTDGIVAEEFRKLSSEEQRRFYPLVGGINPNDKFAINHVKRMFEYYPDVFCGIGEVFFRHDDLTALTYGEAPRPNNEAFYPIMDFATEKDLPVLIHQNITSVGVPDHPKYLPELETLLREYPRTKLVFAHCGASRRVYAPFYHEMVDRLLEEYKNLYVDLSWVVYDAIICPDGIPNPHWIELAEKHSHRMCIGSDTINAYERLGVTLQRYDTFLDALSPEARENLCINTARTIYGKKNNVK